MRDNLPGCSLIVLGIAIVSAALTILNQTHGNAERERLDRMRKVLAVVTDKGISTYQRRDQRPGRLGDVTVDRSYWIRFECQIGGAIKEGSRLSLFPLPEERLWNGFEKGSRYEAHYDPVDDECILVVDEPPGGLSAQNMISLWLCGVTAAVALVVFVATRRRGSSEERPVGPGR